LSRYLIPKLHISYHQSTIYSALREGKENYEELV
jgi:hypothetical protein